MSATIQRGTFLDRRLIIAVGKGGVGKTTTSVALAFAASYLEKTTLLVEVGDADAIGPLFKRETLGPDPEEMSPGVYGARINPKLVLDEYVHEFIGSTFIANRITRSQLFDHIATATPGLKEALTMGQIWRWEQEQNETGTPRFDVIIVDAPATGHGLSLLRVTQVLVDMIRVGPIAEQTQLVNNLLHDPQRTSLALITLPEELPVNEAIEFHTAAGELLDMPVDVTFVNRVYPKLFTQREAAHIERLYKSHRLKNGDGDFTLPLLEAARTELSRRELQETHIRRLERAITGQLVQIPFFFTNELSTEDLESIAEILLCELGR